MLTLNYDSWFMRKFLGYDMYNVPPKTICELGRVVLGMTFLWFVISTVALSIIALYLTAVFGVLYVMFTDATLSGFFNFNVKEATWTGMAWLIFLLGNAALLVASVITGVKWLKEWKRGKRYAAQQKYFEETGKWESPPEAPKPITEFFKGIWGRFHDKTCMLIEWSNDPESIRARERKERATRLAKPVAEHNLASDSES